MSTPATLLFAHATGFCKEIWNPIVRRVQASSLLHKHAGDVQCVAFDFPYHGSLRDESVAPQLHLEDPAAPRVTHTMNQWVQISSDAVYNQVKQLRAAEVDATHKTPIIGIGHSMGAVALWNTEVAHPGTFDGLVLFEPVYRLHVGPTAASTSFLVNISLQREFQWPTREAAVAYFESFQNFASWDREMLRNYVDGAVVHDAATDTFVLALHPHIEASVYTGKSLDLTDSELARPQCRTIFHSGARTKLFNHEYFATLAATLPHIYAVGTPMPGTSHLMVFEDPDETSQRIVEGLAQFSVFRDASQEEQGAAMQRHELASADRASRM